MTRALLLCLFTSFLFCNSSAQKKTYIGIEAAATGDVYEYLDKGPLLKKQTPISNYFGLVIRHDLSPNVFAETGLLYKSYNEGIAFNNIPGYSSSNAIIALLVPFRLGTRIPILNKRIQLVPVIGYTHGINMDYGYGDGGLGGYTSNIQDTVYFNMYSKLSLRKNFPLLQTGLGIEFRLLKSLLVSVSGNYYTGFENLMEQDISYSLRTNSYTATGLSRGDMFSIGLAIKYPISFSKRKK